MRSINISWLGLFVIVFCTETSSYDGVPLRKQKPCSDFCYFTLYLAAARHGMEGLNAIRSY